MQERSRYSLCQLQVEGIQRDFDARNKSYVDMISHCNNPAASPYHELLDDLNAMEAQSDTLTAIESQVIELQKRFEGSFASKKQVDAANPDDWKIFQDYHASLDALKVGMDAAAKKFKNDAIDYDYRLDQNHIKKMEVGELRQQLSDFLDNMDHKAQQFETDNEADHRQLNTLQTGLSNPLVVSEEQDLLEKMDQVMVPIRQIQEDERYAIEDLIKGLPSSGEIWTGPGMSDQGPGAMDVWTAINSFQDACAEALSLQQRFMQVNSTPGPLP
jgi:hypothetical protein